MAQRLSVTDIAARKGTTPLVVLTCYTAPMARILDPHVDIMLVGDSLGMVVYGMPDTRSVTLETMIAHGRAVVASSSHALVVIDMPAGSYEASPARAIASSQRVLEETGAQMIKLEGGRDMMAVISSLVREGIPVMAHVGLMPQRVKDRSGFRYQGRTPEDAARILEDALAVQEAGASAVVIEAVAESVARDITARLSIPTIGIGASAACDGQVLVIDDMLDMGGYMPSFVKHYAHLAPIIEQAVTEYASDVRSRTFPDTDHVFIGKKK